MKRGVEACALLMIIPERVSLLRSIALLVGIRTVSVRKSTNERLKRIVTRLSRDGRYEKSDNITKEMIRYE